MEGQFVLTITAQEVICTDGRFAAGSLGMGTDLTPVDVYLKRADGETVTYPQFQRKKLPNQRFVHSARERLVMVPPGNQTVAKLACKAFEKELQGLSQEERAKFRVCQYKAGGQVFQGIYPSVEGFKEHNHNVDEFVVYDCADGETLVFRGCYIFSNIIFVQECLKKFGNEGDKLVLTYKEEPGKEKGEGNKRTRYSRLVTASKNVIFRGAPGTGKSFLAKSVAADIVSGGRVDRYDALTEYEKKRVEFVQFHPSYDYTDFVEGLRPKINRDGSMGFELRDGVFKAFVDRARDNYEGSHTDEDPRSVRNIVERFLADRDEVERLILARFVGIEVVGSDAQGVTLQLDDQEESHLSTDALCELLDAGERFYDNYSMWHFLEDRGYYSADEGSDFSYAPCYFCLYEAVLNRLQQNYVFIIDEINRGEISKIFGELFFSIDPGYRGRAGEVSTQYANLHTNPSEKFYIPENVYIIGTMNDIDRSVDTFDFAMRRRFRFIELKADECVEMLDALGDEREQAIRRMTALNRAILQVEDLNENYQIGAAYFLKLKTLTADELWTDYLQPLLRDYVQGMYDEAGILARLEQAYRLEDAQ